MYDSDLSNEEWLIIQHHFNPKDHEETLTSILKNQGAIWIPDC